MCYLVRRLQCILIFEQFLNTKEEVKKRMYAERKMEEVRVVRALKNQCEPEPRVKIVPIKCAPITPLNLTFPPSVPVVPARPPFG